MNVETVNYFRSSQLINDSWVHLFAISDLSNVYSFSLNNNGRSRTVMLPLQVVTPTAIRTINKMSIQGGLGHRYLRKVYRENVFTGESSHNYMVRSPEQFFIKIFYLALIFLYVVFIFSTNFAYIDSIATAKPNTNKATE